MTGVPPKGKPRVYAVKVPDDDVVQTSMFTRMVRARLDAIRRERAELMAILNDLEDNNDDPSNR